MTDLIPGDAKVFTTVEKARDSFIKKHFLQDTVAPTTASGTNLVNFGVEPTSIVGSEGIDVSAAGRMTASFSGQRDLLFSVRGTVETVGLVGVCRLTLYVNGVASDIKTIVSYDTAGGSQYVLEGVLTLSSADYVELYIDLHTSDVICRNIGAVITEFK